MKSNAQYTETESGEIPEVLLKDYCELIQYGYTQSASLEEIGPKFLRITDIQNKPINWGEVPFCKISDSDLSKYLLDNGDIVIARTGASTGTNAIFDSSKMPKSVFASYLIRLKLSKIFDPWFVYYFLQSPYYSEHIVSILGGSAQPNANAQQLTNVFVKKFNFSEQQQIASILSSLDDKIELNRRMNNTLEEIGKALFKRWFVDFEFPNENVEPYKSAGGVMVASGLGEIPANWEIKKIEDVCEINTKSINPGRSGDKSFWHFSIPSFDQYSSPTLELGNTIKSNKTQINSNSILISKLNPKKEKRIWTIYVDSWNADAISSTEFINVVPNAGDWAWGNFMFRDDKFYKYFASLSTGSTGSRQRVRPTEIKTLKVAYPDEMTRQRFDDMASHLLLKINENMQEILNLTSIRDSLLPRLISGKIRVN